MMATGKEFEVLEVGVFTPKAMPTDELTVGDVGYLTAAIKNVGDTRVGDTITSAVNPAKEALPGYRKLNPMVYCGLYPIDTAKYNDLREALEKLELNDSSLQYEAEHPKHLASASAAASLACFIWKSSKNGLNVNLKSTLLRQRQVLFTMCI